MNRNRCLTFFLGILLVFQAKAQTPLVPDRLVFADIDIRLTRSAQQEVQDYVNSLTQSRSHFEEQAQRAAMYFPIVERVLREEGAPEDLKYLPIQESGYQAGAVSKSNAVGYWQFKSFTALEVGLRVDGHVDERRNIVSATRGAARYLKKNNFYFNNWVYAIVAYYEGRGGAEKYVNEQNYGKKKMEIGKKDHWYFKRFLAHKIAFENAVDRVEQQPIILTEYTRGNRKNLKSIAKETSTDPELLQEYNQWLLKGSVPTDKAYAVIVPVTNGKRKEYLALQRRQADNGSASPAPMYQQIQGTIAIPTVSIVEVNGIEAVIAGKDETITSLAERGNVDEDDLINFNDLDYGDDIKAGQVYYLKKKKNRAKVHYHTLGFNETLWAVSQKYGVKLIKLLKKNRISLAEELKPGRVIWLRKTRPKSVPVSHRTVARPVPDVNKPIVEKEPIKRMESKASEDSVVVDLIESDVVPLDSLEEKTIVKESGNGQEENALVTAETSPDPVVTEVVMPIPRSRKHQVAKGETLYSIAKTYGIGVMELAEYNKIELTNPLSIGQQLKLPKPQENAASDVISYQVKPGDTLYTIARKYGVSVSELQEWNQKSDYDVQVDEVLRIKSSETGSN
jgi:membrane-bound lytic murein transglycosylase D